MNARFEMLEDTLKALASSPEEQSLQLRQQGTPGCVDELALDFDAIAAATDDMLQRGEIGAIQRDCIKALNDYLDNMSGEAKAHLWTVEALSSAPEWREVRRKAT